MKGFVIAVLLLSIGLSTFVAFNFDHRGHYTGDSISNDNLWIASKNFAVNGFFKLRFVPVHEEVFLDPNLLSTENLKFYTHYPSGGEWIHGFLYKLGMRSRSAHQVFAMLVMYTGALLALTVLLTVFPPWPALLAWSVCIITPSFIFFADSLHAYTWFFLFNWYFLFRILDLKQKVDSNENINLNYKALEFFVLGFVASWFSIDAVVPLLSIGLLSLFVLPKKMRLRYGLMLVAAAPLGEIIGFSLHIMKNAAVLGGFSRAFEDIFGAFLIRSGQGERHEVTRHLGKLILGFPWFFTIPAIIAAIVGWYKKLTNDRELFWVGLFCATFLAAATWQILMKQHAMIHDFTIRHSDLFIVFGFGLFCQTATLPKSRLIAGGVVAFLIIHSLLGVLRIEGGSMKRPLIDALVSDRDRVGWACKQSMILQADDLQDLDGAQNLVRRMLPNDCSNTTDTSSIEGRLAEMVLYWR